MSWIKLTISGLAVVVATVGVGATAFAGPLHWYADRCVDQPNHDGLSKDRNSLGECIETLSKHFHLYEVEEGKLAEGESISVISSGGLQLLKTVVAGVAVEIHCTALDNSGKLENPVGGGAGTGLVTDLFLNCSILPSSLGCELPEHMATAVTQAVLIGTSALPEVLFLPDGAPTVKTFAELTFQHCTIEGLNTTFKIQGSVLGMVNNATSGIAVDEIKGAGSMVRFAGNEASLIGAEDIVETEAKGKLEAKE